MKTRGQPIKCSNNGKSYSDACIAPGTKKYPGMKMRDIAAKLNISLKKTRLLKVLNKI